MVEWPSNTNGSISRKLNQVIKNLRNRILRKLRLRIQILRSRPKWQGENDRFSYQSPYIGYKFKGTDKVLDIGSGSYPFPFATVLADRFMGKTSHRDQELRRDGKPLVLSDISALPFRTKCFDFVYCSHLLEHVDDPIAACSELIRVGTCGFIEAPTFTKDMLFAWAEGMHKWHILSASDRLIFIEYSQRQKEGIRSSVWRDIILGPTYHPLQSAFYENQDLFNTMFSWTDRFKVVVIRLDGEVENFVP